MTVTRARERAEQHDPDVSAAAPPERTCFRCDEVFRVPSDDRRVYCLDCRERYGFPAPTLTDFRPGTQLGLFSGQGRCA